MWWVEWWNRIHCLVDPAMAILDIMISYNFLNVYLQSVKFSVADNQLTTSHCSSLNCKQEQYMKLDVCVFPINRGQVDCINQNDFFVQQLYDYLLYSVFVY